MKKCLLIGFCAALIVPCCLSQNNLVSYQSELTIEQNIAKNAIAFQSNNEFYFFDDIAERSSVISLGERGHDDISSYEVKSKMINYLKTKQFKSVALEAAPFLSTYVFSNPEYCDLTKDWKIEHFWWLMFREGKEEALKLFTEAVYRQEIKIYGMDSHLGDYDVISAKAILDKYLKMFPVDINWSKLQDFYTRYFVFYEYPNIQPLRTEEQYELMRMIDTISNYVHYIISEKERTTDLAAVLQWIRNINTGFSYVKYNNPQSADMQKFIFRNRDIQMAENMIWLTKNYPKEKFIIWQANFHGAKDISQTTYPTDSLLYFIFQSMGETLYNELGDKFYSLAIASLSPEIENRGVLESEIDIVTNNTPFAFVDFKPLRYADGYRDKELDSEVIMKKKGKWLYIFDGLYYIKDQKYSQ